MNIECRIFWNFQIEFGVDFDSSRFPVEVFRKIRCKHCFCYSSNLVCLPSLTPVSGWQAEWLYSQSKGRQFSVGEQSKLVEFLMATCPLDPDQETDQDRKLNLILSKVQVSNDLLLQNYLSYLF